ncbi:MAG: nucleotide exchange factor GrpE [Mycobacteriaceae bacterium]
MSEQEMPEADTAQEEAAAQKQASRQIADLEEGWRRTAAELDNFRKRCAQDLVRTRQEERAAVATRWLPVIDNLERALAHASSEPDQIIEGVRGVYEQALSVLSELGFPRRDDAGRAFDPALHEAVSAVTDEQFVPGTVAQVVRPGYGTDERILRPAAVVVATRDQ